MRTSIVIDDKLLRDALRATGLKTKREVVELGLRTLLAEADVLYTTKVLSSSFVNPRFKPHILRAI